MMAKVDTRKLNKKYIEFIIYNFGQIENINQTSFLPFLLGLHGACFPFWWITVLGNDLYSVSIDGVDWLGLWLSCDSSLLNVKNCSYFIWST